MSQKFDIDIDVKSNTNKALYGLRCSIWDTENEAVVPHPSGYIIGSQPPCDTLTGLSAIDYREIEYWGYHKVDLINNSYLNLFTSKEELLNYMNKEPNWELFQDPQMVNKLPHIRNHFELVHEVQPQNVEQLADILSLIRPQKQQFLKAYKDNPKYVRDHKLFQKTTKKDGSFKKSHAFAYAFLIIGVINKLEEDRADSYIEFD